MAIRSSKKQPPRASAASASPAPSNDPPVGSREWYDAVEKRGEELGELLYEKLKDKMGSKIRPSPAIERSSQGLARVVRGRREARSDEPREMLYEMAKRPTGLEEAHQGDRQGPRAHPRRVEATARRIRAEMELLGPRCAQLAVGGARSSLSWRSTGGPARRARCWSRCGTRRSRHCIEGGLRLDSPLAGPKIVHGRR